MNNRRPKDTFGQFITKYPITGTAGILTVMFVFFIVASPLNKDGFNLFLSWRNLSSVLETSAAYSIGAFAMTMVLLSGGIDLSCGSTIALSGVVSAYFITNLGLNFVLGSAIGLAVGIIIGLINAVLIVELKLPPFLATLGVANVIQGISFMVSQGYQIYIRDEGFINTFGFGNFLGIPSLVWWTAIFLILTYIIISQMKFGRRLQAIGGNEIAAANSGVNVRFIKYITYSFMGMVSAFVSLTIVGMLHMAQADQGGGYALNFIVCAILGGTDFAGGGGNVFGVLLGSLVLAVFSNGLSLLNTDSFLQLMLEGLIIILAIIASVTLTRRRAR
jgi:ribose transport system permease protein